MQNNFDVIIIGTGTAGLITALNINQEKSILIINKTVLHESASYYAQGGIAVVLDPKDSVEKHVQDTLIASQNTADEQRVKLLASTMPKMMVLLKDYGIEFNQTDNSYDLSKEAGHSHRRIAHMDDTTGSQLQHKLLNQIKKRENITIVEKHIALDLYCTQNRCHGVYILNNDTQTIYALSCNQLVLSTGGASKCYLYTSNPDTSTGDGIAMAYRQGCQIANMEFIQFHPTCLYHPQAKSFLISETLRGEGATLHLANGLRFMHKYHSDGELAPRDVVALSIDKEMKRRGIDCVYLDISFKNNQWIKERFPNIYKHCLQFGIDICNQKIPVVPAAHYTCGGIVIDDHGQTNIDNLYAIGEVSYSGVHGGNRLASNSLAECLVFGHRCAMHINTQNKNSSINPLPWNASPVKHHQEDKLIITYWWQEIRRIMWDFVGIVRNDNRLQYAHNKLIHIEKEINYYYWKYSISSDLIELRNLICTSLIIVKCAIKRKNSIALHYNEDHTQPTSHFSNTIVHKNDK